MKIKAVYKSKTDRPKISVCGETFFNNVPRIVNISYRGLCIIKRAEQEGWFEILEEYKKGTPVKTAPAVEKTTTVEPVAEETTVVEPTAEDAVEETTVVEPTAEETTVEETTTEDAVAEEPISLEAMTKAELLAYAAENNIEVSDSMKKAEIIAAING